MAQGPQKAQAGQAAEDIRRARHRGSVVAVAAACAVVALVAVYCAGCLFFCGHFWPNTRIGATDVSLMSRAQASEALQRTSDALALAVSGQGVDFSLTGDNAGLQLNVDEAVSAALAGISIWQWPWQVFQEHDASDVLSSSFDTDLLRTTVEALLATYNSGAEDPVDAFLYFDEASETFQINPGSAGTKLDVDSVVDTVVAALAADRSRVSLTSADLVQQQVTADDPDLAAARDAANALLACNIQLTVNGTAVAELGPATVKDWLVFGEDGAVTLDDAQLSAWVDTVEAQVDTAGGSRSYTRPDGKYVTVSGGTYGWISDGAALEQLVRDCVANGAVGAQEIPLKQSAAQYNPGGQDWGARYIDIDLSEQYVRFYGSDGSLIWSSACITGAPDGHETPIGVYYINNKATDQTLVGQTDPNTGEPEYESEVAYWMPFIGNMIGLHDASWQSDWSSTAYTYTGSHGCVNLPVGNAAELFGLVQVGDVVVVHY